MLAVPVQARLVQALMVLTVAGQAFVYGWVFNAVGPSDAGAPLSASDIARAWMEAARPPVGALLERLIQASVGTSPDPVRAADRVRVLTACGAHVLWVSMAWVLAGTYAAEGVSALWGYMLAAWNPLAVYAIVERRWDVLVGQCLLGLAFYAWLCRWWMVGIYLFWAALAVNLHVLFWWPALAWRVLCLRRVLPRILALLPGVILAGWVLSHTGVEGWMRGWAAWWWGEGGGASPGWNVFTLLVGTAGARRLVGWLSLVGWLLFTTGLLEAYAVGAMRFRTLMTWCAVGAWLLFWQSRLVEIGTALYWLGLYVAHGARWYREPPCTSAEAGEPE